MLSGVVRIGLEDVLFQLFSEDEQLVLVVQSFDVVQVEVGAELEGFVEFLVKLDEQVDEVRAFEPLEFRAFGEDFGNFVELDGFSD